LPDISIATNIPANSVIFAAGYHRMVLLYDLPGESICYKGAWPFGLKQAVSGGIILLVQMMNLLTKVLADCRLSTARIVPLLL